jgi:hypothetical protein
MRAVDLHFRDTYLVVTRPFGLAVIVVVAVLAVLAWRAAARG